MGILEGNWERFYDSPPSFEHTIGLTSLSTFCPKHLFFGNICLELAIIFYGNPYLAL